jgi:FOG: CBS domain
MRDVKVEFPTYLHLLDGFIMYPPATARFESELKKAVGATVEDVMTPDPVTVQADTAVSDAATLMVERDVSRLPVLDGDRLVGIISKSDIVRSLIAED